MIVGDFNVDFSRSQSQFTMTLSQFMYDHGLVAADQVFAHKIPYTYESDSGVGHSWIDHILISRTGGCHVSDVSLVHSSSNLSDHSPMICTIDMSVEQVFTEVPSHATARLCTWHKAFMTYNVMRAVWRRHCLQL